MITNEIRCIAEQLQKSVNPQKIYLFGSFARNEEQTDSDYDFYLVMSDSVTDRLSVSQKAYRSLRGLKRRSVDIVVGSVSGFQERKTRKTLENIVHREGLVLYEKWKWCKRMGALCEYGCSFCKSPEWNSVSKTTGDNLLSLLASGRENAKGIVACLWWRITKNSWLRGTYRWTFKVCNFFWGYFKFSWRTYTVWRKNSLSAGIKYHVVKALSDMKTIYDFVTNKINELQALCNRGIE